MGWGISKQLFVLMPFLVPLYTSFLIFIGLHLINILKLVPIDLYSFSGSHILMVYLCYLIVIAAVLKINIMRVELQITAEKAVKKVRENEYEMQKKENTKREVDKL